MRLSLFLLSAIVASCHAFSQQLQGSPPHCINLKCKVKQSFRDEFLALVKDNQIRTLEDEPDALEYVVGEDVEEPNVFYIHEQFETLEAFAFHRETPHNKNWQKFKTNDPFSEQPVASFYDGTHKATKVPIRDAYCLNVQLCVDPKYREEFLEVIANNARGSIEEEPLCLQYVWGEDCAIPNTFHFHEQYVGSEDGKEGFVAHSKTKHFEAWENFVTKDPFTKPPVVQFYKTL
ncbi:expressed unknown protein [Seminavis robusta]|uniref:ABM domain-containing protein n=1 Tax=Seminavis robusta TaxID=568900 RepID=A0A9N8HFG8_9STRA|nr:expressed unknown protein [Seminavis robusta]|eukprot:Sro435_g142230.1 n/a (233) ;mRNA; f:8469-9167